MEKVKTKKTGYLIAIIMAALAVVSLILAGILDVVAIGFNCADLLSLILSGYFSIPWLISQTTTAVNSILQTIGYGVGGLLLPVSLLVVSLVLVCIGSRKKGICKVFKVICIVFAVIAALVLVLQVAGNGVNGVAEVALRIWDLNNEWFNIVQSLREIASIVPGTRLLLVLLMPVFGYLRGNATPILQLLAWGISALSNLLYILPNVLCLVGFVLSIFSGKKKKEEPEIESEF